MEGTIVKTLSGFYYVSCGGEVYECRARGKFRLDGTSPLVGDKVSFAVLPNAVSASPASANSSSTLAHHLLIFQQ